MMAAWTDVFLEAKEWTVEGDQVMMMTTSVASS
jgi:hypothetical protein